ncbi:MAG: ABC transporter permease subunit [Candidatus Aminicenantes bacterium]|nr:ABC transporter permease subunit [Candidatus Aminicenantes bacterium]
MRFWTIALTDLKIALKDKMFFMWLLLFPLLFSFVFGMAFQGSSPADIKATLNILDLDQSVLSKALIEELTHEKYDIAVVEKKEESEIRVLIIPEGFSEKVINGQKVELVLEKKAESSMEAGQAAYTHILKAVIKVITRLIDLAPENIHELRDHFSQTTVKKIIALKVEQAGRLKTIPSGFNHSIPGTTVMFLLFTVLMYGGINLLEERRQGQLERIITTPATFSAVISGKWITRVLIGMLQITLMFLAGRLLFGVYLGGSLPALLLVSLFFCGTIAGMSILFGCLIQKEEVLIVLNILAANLMAALGGCWWPLELVPKSMRIIGLIFPTGWTMNAYHKLISFGYGFWEVLPHIGILALFSLVFLFLAVKFFRLR